MSSERIPYDTEVNKKEIGKKIRNIRKEKGLTMEELGNKLSASKGAVYNWERGKNLPNKARLNSIAELSNMSVNELLYGKKGIFYDSDVDKNEVGSRIKDLRRQKGMTMEEFGESIDKKSPASDSIVSRWERGISLPSNDRLPKIAELGNISVNELLYGKTTTDEIIMEFKGINVSDLDTERIERVQAVANNVLLDCMMELHKRGVG